MKAHSHVRMHGAKCVKHTNNNRNILQLSKHGKNPKFGTNQSPNECKNVIQAFCQTHSMHTLTLYNEQCMIMMKNAINTCPIATWGQHNQQKTKWD